MERNLIDLFSAEEEKAIVERDFGKLVITSSAVNNMIQDSLLYRGHVLTSLGRIYTDDEWEQKNYEILDIGWFK